MATCLGFVSSLNLPYLVLMKYLICKFDETYFFIFLTYMMYFRSVPQQSTSLFIYIRYSCGCTSVGVLYGISGFAYIFVALIHIWPSAGYVLALKSQMQCKRIKQKPGSYLQEKLLQPPKNLLCSQLSTLKCVIVISLHIC